ncbi:PAS domain-containing protein [Aureococcus anophagefferens]|nr:PAS domain-containing protein [Aureococcus anophagefferens]
MDAYFSTSSDLPVEPGSAKMANERLREFVREKLGAEAAAPSLEYCAAQSKGDGDAEGEASLSEGGERTRAINKYDYGLLEALKHARRSFVITDPTLPDNPIVFASGGFLSLTGYKLEQVLAATAASSRPADRRAVGKIREAIKHGTDVQICLLNYKIDSTTFWNHFFIAALRDDAGDVVNFLGVQIEVSERVAMGILQNMDGKAADGKAAPAAAPADGAAKAPTPPSAPAPLRRRRPMSAARRGRPDTTSRAEPRRLSSAATATDKTSHRT